jgi:hypothetical protein
MNNTKKKSAIDRFLNVGQLTSHGNRKIVLDEREGLIERIDKVVVTRDGKQLLREQY